MAQKAASRYAKSPTIDAKESEDTKGAEKSAASEAKDPPKVGDDKVKPKEETATTPKGGDETGTEAAPVNGTATPAGDNASMHAQMMKDMAKRHMAEMTQTHRRHQRERTDLYGQMMPADAGGATPNGDVDAA